MKYMFLMYGDERSWTDDEWTDCTVESSAICHELASKGQFVAASPLHPVSTATSLRVREGKRLITDGPFAETTEQLGGYFIVDVANLDEALAIASRLPPARKGTVEIRPVYELPPITVPDACEIMSSRDLPFSRELVFGAFADREKLARFWGPEGFRNTFHEFQFQPGGEWEFVMHGPDGTDYKNHSVFESIVAPERIVLEHLSAPHFRMTMTFSDLPKGHTRLVWLMRFDTPSIRDQVAKIAVDANQQNFDRLHAVLQNSANNDKLA